MASAKNPFTSFLSYLSFDIKADKDLISNVSDKLNNDIQIGNTESGIGFDIETYSMMSQMLLLPETRIAFYNMYDQMDNQYQDVSIALDLIADETTSTNLETNQVVWVTSKNQKIAELLNHLIQKTLKWQDGTYLNQTVRSLCKYGDEFQEIIVDKYRGVISTKSLPVRTVHAKFDILGKVHGYEQHYSFSNHASQAIQFQPWQISHLKLPSKEGVAIYGNSMLFDAITPIKKLEAVELSTILARMSSSVDRYLFKIPVGKLGDNETKARLNEVKNALRKKRMVNTEGGEFKSVNDILTAMEDLFVPTRDTGSIEVSQLDRKGKIADSIPELEYFRKKEIASLKIPMQFVSMEEILQGDKTPGNSDIRLARRVRKIQNITKKFIYQICDVHLAYTWYDKAEEYEINMNNVSQLEEHQALEAKELKYNLAGTMKGFIPEKKIYTEILGYTDEEADELIADLRKETRELTILNATNQALGQRVSDQIMQQGQPTEEQPVDQNDTQPTDGEQPQEQPTDEPQTGQEQGVDMAPPAVPGQTQEVKDPVVEYIKNLTKTNKDIAECMKNLVEINKEKRRLKTFVKTKP